MSGNFFSCIKGVKDPFEAQEGRWDFSRDATVRKASACIEDLLIFHELRQETWSSSRVETGMSGNLLSCLKDVKDPLEAQEGRWDFS